MKITKYTNNHLWVRYETSGDRDESSHLETRAEIGITKYGIEHLSGISYADLPDAGQNVKKNEELCVLETTKTVYSVVSPCDGKIVEKCEDISMLENNPENIPLVVVDCISFVSLYDTEPIED